MLKDFWNTLATTHTLPLGTCRYDLDACDIQEKYPDLFQVNLEVEVEPRDRPSQEAPPWENTSLRGLNPKILFSSREEQQDILSKFGKLCPGSLSVLTLLGKIYRNRYLSPWFGHHLLICAFLGATEGSRNSLFHKSSCSQPVSRDPFSKHLLQKCLHYNS